MMSHREFDTAASRWRYWKVRVCELLQMQPDASLGSQVVTSLWFLTPSQAELDEVQADDLMRSIRRCLYSKGVDVWGVRANLLALSPDASLPFLYAMRYIAFREAGRHVYWPAFREVLFANELSYTDVAIKLAPITSALWLRLYEATHGALYFPREGPRHIKWPLAHAGLLADDKDVLRAFGADVLSSGVDLFRSVVDMEIDEFVLLFCDWLDSAKHGAVRFGELMSSQREERYIIAELGQQWLRAHMDEIAERSQQGAARSGTISRVKRGLHYSSRANELSIRIAIGRLRGRPTVSLNWDGQVIPIPGQYLSSSDEMVPMELVLPLRGAVWADTAVLSIDSERLCLSMPRFDRNKAVVFESSSGSRTKRWELGCEYYVLIPGRRLKEESASVVFQDWAVLGEPLGEWADYSMLWVRTRDPLSGGAGFRGDSGSIISVVESLEQAADHLGLPSFGHQYRMRMALVGGELTGRYEPRTPAFTGSRPPYAELRGVWTGDVCVTLSRLDPISGQYVGIDSLTVRRGMVGKSCILELWEREALPGTYRLDADGQCLEFVVSDQVATGTDRLEGAASIDLWFEDSVGTRIENASRHALPDVYLRVRAWPHADLVLRVSCTEGQISYTMPLLVGASGEGLLGLGDFAFNLAEMPRGSLSFSASWRGLFTASVEAVDRTYVSARDLAVTVREMECGSLVVCKGMLVGSSDTCDYVGLLFPRIPWRRRASEMAFDVDSRGEFQGHLCLDWKPGWLIVAAKDTAQHDGVHTIAVREIGEQPDVACMTEAIRVADAIGEYGQVWFTVASRLLEVSHTPRLTPYLHIAALLEFVRSANSLSLLRPQWLHFCRWEDLRRARELAEHGCCVALFRLDRSVGVTAQRTNGVEVDFSELDRDSSELRFAFVKAVGRAEGLIRASGMSDDRLLLFPSSALCGCLKCGLIVPHEIMNSHIAPYKESPGCTRESLSFHSYRPDQGRPQPICIGVLVEPLVELAELMKEMQYLLDNGVTRLSDYRSLLVELRYLVPQDTTPRDWLGGLLYALERFALVHQREHLTYSDLLDAARAVVPYKDAISKIIDRVGTLVS